MKPVYTCTVVLVVSLLFGAPLHLAAQESTEAFILPDSDALVQALADAASRDQALLSLIVIKRLASKSAVTDGEPEQNLVVEFSNERSRLNQVAGMNKYLRETPASLDLASQVLQQELAQHRLPLWADPANSVAQIVIRAEELLFSTERLELAAAVGLKDGRIVEEFDCFEGTAAKGKVAESRRPRAANFFARK